MGHITLFASEVLNVQLRQEWYFHSFPVIFFIPEGKEKNSKEQIFGQT